MSAGVRANLHCHSSLSDGDLSPEAVAALLVEDGVVVASLTDHNTVEGLVRFREALAGTPARSIPGVELTAGDGGPVDLLAYGFDPGSPALAEALARARRAPDGSDLPVRDAIGLIHQAGGRVFLAHPLVLDREMGRLEARLLRYREWGLDGIEAIYSPYSEDQIRQLMELARRLDLVVSAGCDFHGTARAGLADRGVTFPAAAWRSFRDRVLAGSSPRPVARPEPPAGNGPQRLNWRSLLLRILLPTALAIALLVGPLLLYLIPAFEEALLARKREMIRELAKSAASILQEYHDEERSGRLSREEAQAAAVERIQFLRYGKEGKDYFWITDLQPRMVVHPYRLDLNGQDLTGYRDPEGNRVFVELARLVQERGEGYLEYVWQWKDDAGRLEPKQSYVRGFAPWGWIIGTGLYLEDVQAEIRGITGRVIRVTLVVALVIALLLLFVALQSLRLERQRLRAEQELHESHERYRTLVEAAREGTALVLDGRIICANRTFLDLTGYAEEHLAFMAVEEILEVPAPGGVRALLAGARDASGTAREPVEAVLRPRGGGADEVVLSIEPVRLGEQAGVSLVVRDLAGHKEMKAALAESQARFRAVAENVRVGVFRASLEPGLPLVEANTTARRLFGVADGDESPCLAALLGDDGALESLTEALLAHGEVHDLLLELAPPLGRRISLTATLVRDEAGSPVFCDAVVEDVTARQREVREQEALIADLQSAHLSLGRAVGDFMREPVSAPSTSTVERAAQIMARHGTDTLFVEGTGGEPLGLITDRDLRERVVARGLDPGAPLYEVMSAPILAVSLASSGGDALALMQERNVRRLAVRGPGGRLAGVLHRQDLTRVDHVPLDLLARSIAEAPHLQEVLDRRARLPTLVHPLLESGARPRYLCRAICAAADALTRRLTDLAHGQLGPPAVPWAFLALGSQGRGEQTLLADQDSALVFAVPPGADERALQESFLAMAQRVGEWLEQAGYPSCKGGMVAANPRWCRSLEGWQRHLREWIRQPEPQSRLEFASFFDFRCVAGDPSLAQCLRDFVREELAHAPAFFPLLARDVVSYRPPTGLFGGLGSHSGGIDTKDAAAAIENLVRLYALQRGLEETGTFDRLRRLAEVGVLSATGGGELEQAYDFVMTLRLRRQEDRLRAGQPADNEVDPRSLNRLEEALLKQVFALIGTFQKKIQYDFLGAAGI
ncbi:MAG TPA: DUF294 nucleotidyltransferase-like domain-containing protein [Thermoanaerobaculia bacterium]|nr:DUF294 nucleotidyltransferase-like domain-containing protein [Thermoanaerobaculia bacterium]